MATSFCPFSTDNAPSNMSSPNLDDPNSKSSYPRHVFDDISEKQLERRKRTKSFYFVLFFGVLPVWSVVPLSWTFVAYALYTGLVWQYNWRWRMLLAYTLSEVLFSVYYFCMSHYIAGPTTMTPNSLPELQSAYARVLRAGLGMPGAGQMEVEDAPKNGSLDEEITPLDPMDHRAVDFRNFLRTWYGYICTLGFAIVV